MADRLPVAALAFTATASVRDNTARIRAAIDDAVRDGVRLLAVPECALLGYPGAARADLTGVSWCEIADSEDELGEYARARDIALVLGTAGPVADGSGISNDAVACGRWVRPAFRQGGGLVRYRKRHLTPTDEAHFVAGDTMAVFAIEDWRIGLAICFDVRFPRLWAELADVGCDAVVAIGHMAGPDPDPGTKSRLIPAMLATRAAEWVTPILFANTAAPDRYFDTAAWDARGVCVASCGEGLLRTEWSRRSGLDPWYVGLHHRALASWRGETGDEAPSRVL
jgi:predicted amidohydrolase